MKSTKKQFTAQKLRTLLAFLLVVVILGGAAGFYFGLDEVRTYSLSVNHRLVDAQASGKQIEELQTLRRNLANNNSLVEKANQLFATPATYQAQASTDINAYASAAGIAIARTTFSDPSSGAHEATVSLNNPTSYKGLIIFLGNIEHNIPKMQVTSISLKPADPANASRVVVGDIKISVSVR